ncbi:MAG: 50S ribosomal protein L3 [Dehalococcoidia bacterium]
MVPGILGKKVGMTQLFTETGAVVPVTAIEAGPCTVTQVKDTNREGYEAVQLGFGEAKRLNKPEKGHLKDLGAFKNLQEFRVEDTSEIERGQKFSVELFQPGETVDITGMSKGRGFTGAVKRHGFSGGPKTRGSKWHRATGSIGACTFPGKVFKGKRMPGHMGNERVTVKNVEVVKADPDRNLLLVKGAVPGAKNGLLTIRKSKKASASKS